MNDRYNVIKMIKQLPVIMFLMALIICAFFVQRVNAETIDKGTWKHNSKGYWYEYSDGSYAQNTFLTINGKTYYFNRYGYMVTGWQLINDKWFYFNADGREVTGWKLIKNKWYYFDLHDGAISGWKTINNKQYYFDTNCRMVIGWNYIDDDWYYFNNNGNPITGWKEINNRWYFFCEEDDSYWYRKYTMLTGFQKIDDKAYYLLPNGNNKTGWQLIKSKDDDDKETVDYYYFKTKKGEIASNEVIQNYFLQYNGKWDGNTYSWKKQIINNSFYEFTTWKWTYVDSNNHTIPDLFTMDDYNPFLVKINNQYYCFYETILLTNVYVETYDGYYYVNSNGVCTNPNNFLQQYTGDYVTTDKYYGYYKDSTGYIPKNCTLRMINLTRGGVWGLGWMGDIVQFDKNGTPKKIGDFAIESDYTRYY